MKRRAILAMALVMREVIRGKKRAAIKASSFISLSFDDRKAHKLVTFNCGIPLRHRGGSGELWATGMIGCLDLLHGETLQSMDEDYAERTCTKIMAMIDKFATPWGRNPETKRCTRSSVLPLAALSSTEPS